MTYNVKLKQKCSRINQTCDKAPFGAIVEHNYVYYTYIEEEDISNIILGLFKYLALGY